MSLYPELDGKTADELMAAFYGPPLDGGDGAVAFYQELADMIAEAGARGVDFLWGAADRTTDVPRRRALIFALSRHAQRSDRLRTWLRWMLNADPDVAAEAACGGLGIARLPPRSSRSPAAALNSSAALSCVIAVTSIPTAPGPISSAPPAIRATSSGRTWPTSSASSATRARSRCWRSSRRMEHPHVRQAAQSALDDVRA